MTSVDPTVIVPTMNIRFSKGHVRKLPQPRTLDDLATGLTQIFKENEIDIEEVRRYIGSYQSCNEEWRKFAHFDAHKYTRNLINEGNEKFNLILICWSEGQGSCIHDHADSHCFMKILDGSLTETKFEWPEKNKKRAAMIPTESTAYAKDEVAYINDSIGLHRVENKSHTERACSLHLYSPPIQICQSFDQRSGHALKCPSTFTSKCGMLCDKTRRAGCTLNN